MTACLSAQKRKDLTAAEGHVLLVEYMEEDPLLLGRPGPLCRLSLSLHQCFFEPLCLGISADLRCAKCLAWSLMWFHCLLWIQATSVP